jgi:hypothetical protein
MLRITKPLLWEPCWLGFITKRGFPLFRLIETAKGWELSQHAGWDMVIIGHFPSQKAAQKAAQSEFERYVTGYIKSNALRAAYGSGKS